MAESRQARRVTMHEARRHFEAGGQVVVSERGHELVTVVTPSTTVHSAATTTFEILREQVNMWRNRYPNQRYYIVEPLQD